MLRDKYFFHTLSVFLEGEFHYFGNEILKIFIALPLSFLRTLEKKFTHTLSNTKGGYARPEGQRVKATYL